ncbi:MAG: D-cysteine desulfhydrase family protein [Tetrasphaera sp.]
MSRDARMGSGGPSSGELPAIGTLPRLRLAHLPTPLEPMDRLARALGKPPGTLYVKRDDCTGLAGGGNKLRKLEFLVADALAQECDWLVTVGGPQSNSARMVAAVARRHPLEVTLVLTGERPTALSGNLVLDAVLGAQLVWAEDVGLDGGDDVVEAECRRVRDLGHRPYGIPLGASNPLGSLGYVLAVQEIREQCPRVDIVVTATGSAGTHAGLVAGWGDHAAVMGVRVVPRADLGEQVTRMALDTARLAGLPEPVGLCRLEEGFLGGGYGAHTDACAEAIVLAARTEGLILDPVYTGKAMAALIDATRTGRLDPGAVVVFLHTGGMPGLLSDAHGAWAAQAGRSDARWLQPKVDG